MKNNKAKALLASSFLIWGTVGIFVKFIPLNSGVVAFDRSIVGLIFLLLVKLFMKSKVDFKAMRGSVLLLCVNGALLGLNWILLFESYNFTSVATSTICYNMGPMIVVALSPLVFKEKLTLTKAVCVVTALFGVMCVSGLFEEKEAGSRGAVGVVLGLSAAVIYALTVIVNKKLERINPMDKAIVQFMSSSAVMLVYSLVTTSEGELSFTLDTIILLLIVGVVHTGVAYTVYFKALPNVTSQNVALFAYIDPVVAVVLSGVVLKEKLSFFTVLGAVMVVLSAVFSELYDNKQNKC